MYMQEDSVLWIPDKFILLDKCALQCLSMSELPVLSNHNLLLVDMFLIENLKDQTRVRDEEEIITKLRCLEKTYWLPHWHILTLNELLGGLPIKKSLEPLSQILDDPIRFKKQKYLANKVALGLDNRAWLFVNPNSEFLKVNINNSDWAGLLDMVLEYINNNTEICIDLCCKVFQATPKMKERIFQRWQANLRPNLRAFAPYSHYILALELTIIAHILKSKGNHKKEILRDLSYVYYVYGLDITFHTCDQKLMKIINQIDWFNGLNKKVVSFYNNDNGTPNKAQWIETLKK